MLAVQHSDSPRKVFLYLYAVSGQDGLFELDAAQIAKQTSLSRKTVYKAIAFLQRVRLLFLCEARTGRGKHSIYKLNWRKSTRKHHPSTHREQCCEITETAVQKKCHPYKYKKEKKKTHSKDQASEGVHPQKREQFPDPQRQTFDYQGVEASRVHLVPGARFYRSVMCSIRISLESWALPEPICDALEGLYGRRIDGASLDYARELKDKFWALKREIEALARKGASPRRVCSFVAGRLAGVPERRSRREVLKRTAQLLGDVEHLERRTAGLRAWLKEREQEYLTGRVCARCGYVHSKVEYHTGHRADGGGLNCFGFARVKLDELSEQCKLAERRRQEWLCRGCGVLLWDGHVEGLCWACYDRDQAQARIAQGPAPISDLITMTLQNIGLKSPELPS